jgi:hypothetical protein
MLKVKIGLTLASRQKILSRLATGIRTAGVVALLIASIQSSEAQSFDTSKMVGFKVLTAEDGAITASDVVVIRYDGPIAFPMAENLLAIWQQIENNGRFRKVILRLNSPGGTQPHGEAVIDVLREIRQGVELVTLVAENDLCASMCVPIFIQGDTRVASPASAWMFHGATRHLSNIPSLSMTMRFIGYFRERKVGTSFLDLLVQHSYLTSPGEYWLAGKELAEMSDIVTGLAPNWKPLQADPGPFAGVRSGV